VGYLNPTLYALAQDPAHAGVIRDINDGISNAVHWKNQDGTIGGPSRGYTSGPGWDACTGLGVLDGTRLLDALQNL
jgi:kumamolisin